MLYEKYIRVLYIDLNTQKIRIEKREDLHEYLGGVGIASRLLEENMKPELDALDPSQPIVFAAGAASFIFPVLTKSVAMFRSPLTNELGESYAGGRLALSMFLAGYDAMVITGKANKRSYISIGANEVKFQDAEALWGLDSNEVGRYVRDREHGGGKNAGKRSTLCIGPAGENLVSYACVGVDTYRHFGRLGLGAVMGSKNLKALVVFGGDRPIPVRDMKEYFRLFNALYKKTTGTDMMAKYHDAGTPINIEPLNAMNGLPVKNLQASHTDDTSKISGEAFAKRNLVRKLACTGCPVGCIHIGMFRKEFDKGHEYEAINVSYDYELIYALGTFLGIDNSDDILAIVDEVEETGVDAMSAGVCLGWATEAFQKGLIGLDETRKPLEFGNAKNYIKAIRYIATGRNDFYKTLAKGVKAASEKYGGKDFAMHIAGHEMPGYHTGYGSLIGVAAGARHSHLCNGGYSIDQSNKEVSEEEYVQKIYNEECERCVTNSLVMCLFARKVYDKATVLDVLKYVGFDLTEEDLTKIGVKIYETKLRIKKAYGFEQTKVEFPKRYFETECTRGILNEETAKRMLERFEKISTKE